MRRTALVLTAVCALALTACAARPDASPPAAPPEASAPEQPPDRSPEQVEAELEGLLLTVEDIPVAGYRAEQEDSSEVSQAEPAEGSCEARLQELAPEMETAPQAEQTFTSESGYLSESVMALTGAGELVDGLEEVLGSCEWAPSEDLEMTVSLTELPLQQDAVCVQMMFTSGGSSGSGHACYAAVRDDLLLTVTELHTAVTWGPVEEEPPPEQTEDFGKIFDAASAKLG